MENEVAMKRQLQIGVWGIGLAIWVGENRESNGKTSRD